MLVDAFSHREVISQSSSKVSQACNQFKSLSERKEFRGGARDLGSSKISKVAKNIFGFQKPTLGSFVVQGVKSFVVEWWLTCNPRLAP